MHPKSVSRQANVFRSMEAIAMDAARKHEEAQRRTQSPVRVASSSRTEAAILKPNEKRKRDEEGETRVPKKKLRGTSWEEIGIDIMEEVKNSLKMKVKSRDALEKIAVTLEGIAATYGLYQPPAESSESSQAEETEDEENNAGE